MQRSGGGVGGEVTVPAVAQQTDSAWWSTCPGGVGVRAKQPGAVVMVRGGAEQVGECQQRTADLSEEPTERDQLLVTQHPLR